jgi:hypothetical protein
MEYEAFLGERRKRMAHVIRDGFKRLCAYGVHKTAVPVPQGGVAQTSPAPAKGEFAALLIARIHHAGETDNIIFDQGEDRLRSEGSVVVTLPLKDAYGQYCAAADQSREAILKCWGENWASERDAERLRVASIANAAPLKVGRQRREKKVRVPRGQRTDWNTAMVGIDNPALVIYFMQQTDAGRECNLRSRELMFRLGNRRRWFVGARDTHAHVWQRGRFDCDITFWKNGLGHAETVQEVNKETALRFDLFSENDFAFFHESATAKLQTAEWKGAAGQPAEDGAWDETSFFEALGEKGTSVVVAARAILDWVKPHASRLWWSSGRTGVVCPMFGTDGRRYLLRLNTQGRLVLPFDKMKRQPPFNDANKRRELFDRLNQVPGISIPEKAVDKWAKVPLRAFKGDTSEFLKVLDWAVKQIKGTS